MGVRSVAFGLALAGFFLPISAAAALDPADLWRARMLDWETARFWIALVAAALLAVGAGLHSRGRERQWLRVRQVLLVALVFATLFAWWHPYRGSLRSWLHVGDSFHYYVGAKYFDELGYSRLYACTLIADAEAGLPGLREVSLRNLATNRTENAARVLDRPNLCKRHFSPARWQEFAADVAWFRKKLDAYGWQRLRTDHGYNPPPSWTLVGRPLANAFPVGRTSFYFLTSLDPILLALLFGGLIWGFGWPAGCVALLFWGTNQPAAWEWYGGSILRLDWLAASGLGLACVRKGHPIAAAALLAWAVCVRIFPIAIVAGLVLAASWRLLRERSLWPTPFERVFGIAFAGSVAMIVGASSLAVGTQAWVEFADNSQLHLETETVNRLGLHPMLGYREASSLEQNLQPSARDPYERWRAQRSLANRDRRPVYLALATLLSLAIVFSIRGQPSWVAGILALGLVPVLLELGSYYYGFLLLFAPLGRRQPWVGAALMALSAASWCLGEWGDQPDLMVARWGAAVLVFVVGVTALAIFGPDPARDAAEAGEAEASS